MSEFRTRSEGFSALLRYTLGSNAHLRTEVTHRERVLFTFADEPVGSCKKLADDYFADGSVAIGDARCLLECARDLRWTVRQARNNGGRWTPEQVNAEQIQTGEIQE